MADKRFDDENNGISFTASQCHPCFDMNRQGVATVSEAVLKPPQLAPYGVKSLSNFKTASQTKTYE
jgi:hypothetical protein